MLAQWINAAWYLDLAATIALITNLVINRLYLVYRSFFAYLAVDAAQSVIGLTIRSNRKFYSQFYVFSQPVKLALALFVIVELYRVALARHPALARFAQQTVGYTLGAAAVGALSLVMLDSSVPSGRSPVLHRLNSFERTMDVWMLIFLLAICVFMTWFPARLTRNGVLYIAGFVVYFLSRATGLLLTDLAPRFKNPFDLAMLTVSLMCLITWLVALRRDGERSTVVTGHRWDANEMDRLTSRLDSINSRLLGLSRPDLKGK
jgi:hypothetical protein